MRPHCGEERRGPLDCILVMALLSCLVSAVRVMADVFYIGFELAHTWYNNKILRNNTSKIRISMN
jgi:hypothetical protein